MSRLMDYVNKQVLPEGAIPSSCNILETAGKGVVSTLYALLESTLPSNAGTDSEFLSDSGSGERIIWVSFEKPSSGLDLFRRNSLLFQMGCMQMI